MTKTMMEKIKLSINWPIKVEIYVRAANASFPSGFSRNALPMDQFRKLLMTADVRKAMVLPSRINQVPPRIRFRAV